MEIAFFLWRRSSDVAEERKWVCLPRDINELRENRSTHGVFRCRVNRSGIIISGKFDTGSIRILVILRLLRLVRQSDSICV